MMPPPHILRILMDYDPVSGGLTWRYRPESFFTTEARWKGWNAQFPGTPALNCIDDQGYRVGKLLNHSRKAHRVIWAMVYDEVPDQIDHIDHDRSNNALTNLRLGGGGVNRRNLSLFKKNSTGFIGVRVTKSGTFSAQIERTYLGSFKTLDEAVDVRRRAQAEATKAYHLNHGS